DLLVDALHFLGVLRLVEVGEERLVLVVDVPRGGELAVHPRLEVVDARLDLLVDLPLLLGGGGRRLALLQRAVGEDAGDGDDDRDRRRRDEDLGLARRGLARARLDLELEPLLLETRLRLDARFALALLEADRGFVAPRLLGVDAGALGALDLQAPLLLLLPD